MMTTYLVSFAVAASLSLIGAVRYARVRSARRLHKAMEEYAERSLSKKSRGHSRVQSS